jgi:hypothetical protein
MQDAKEAARRARRAAAAGLDQLVRGNETRWRHAFNYRSTRDYRRRPPRLTDAARRVLEDLDRDGVAVSTIEELTEDAGLLGRLQELAGELEAAQQHVLAEHQARMALGTRSAVWDKPFVVELLDKKRPLVAPGGLLASVALQPQLRGIADTYFGLRTRVADVNIWRTLASSQPPQSSQLWHRDVPDDHFVLKSFVYLEDVADGGGPFTYLLRTHRKGDQNLELPSQHDGQWFRATEDAPRAIGVDDRVRTFTGSAGTMIFADTLGYHRGGWARTSPRLLLQTLYASPAARRSRLLGLPEGVNAKDWKRDLAYDSRR